MKKKPYILVSNDDGITAPGIRVLIDLMKHIGNVIVVAPDSPQSGMGHAITLDADLTVETIIKTKECEEYTTSGTPADCVKMAINELCIDIPDVCVSGINHGSNESINMIYSGTMSAALEAGIGGITSIGFSIQDFSWNIDFEQTKMYILKIVNAALEYKSLKGVVLNVNFPKLEKGETYKGIKVCRQAKANWNEKFEKRENGKQNTYYCHRGDFVNLDTEEDTDVYALENRYISVVPVNLDFTAHHYIKKIKNLNL